MPCYVNINLLKGWIPCKPLRKLPSNPKENVNVNREVHHNSRYIKPVKRDFFNETTGTYSQTQNKSISSVATIHNLTLNISSNGTFGFSIDGKFPCEVSHLSAHAIESGLQIGDQIFAVNGSHLYNQPSNVVASFISQASSCIFLTVVRRTSNSMIDSGVGHSAFEATTRKTNTFDSSILSSLRSSDTILKKRKYEDSIDSRRMVKKWKIKSVRNFYTSQHYLNDDKENHIPSILNEGMLLSDSSFKSSDESFSNKQQRNNRYNATQLKEKNGFINLQNSLEPESSGISSFHVFSTNKHAKQQNNTMRKSYNLPSLDSVTPKKAGLNFPVVKRLNFSASKESNSDTSSACSNPNFVSQLYRFIKFRSIKCW